jgi:hypothetical protein
MVEHLFTRLVSALMVAAAFLLTATVVILEAVFIQRRVTTSRSNQPRRITQAE